MPNSQFYRLDLHNPGYSRLVCIPGKADIQSAQLDFFTGLDFSLFADGSNAVYSLAEFAENQSQNSSGVFCISAGFEHFVVCDFFRTQITDGSIH